MGRVTILTPPLQVQNDQCQPTVEESRWMRTTEKGWEFHSVSLGGRRWLGGGVPWRSPQGPLCPALGERMLRKDAKQVVGDGR